MLKIGMIVGSARFYRLGGGSLRDSTGSKRIYLKGSTGGIPRDSRADLQRNILSYFVLMD